MKKEKIYDFGMLGKWSETTLRLQMTTNINGNYPRVDGVEERYNNLLNPINKSMDRIKGYKVKGRTIGNIYWEIKQLMMYDKEMSKLCNDYRNYQSQIAGIKT